MTDYHHQPTEQIEIISNQKKVPFYDKNNVAVVRPLSYKPKQPNANTDNSHYSISETAITVKMEGILLNNVLPDNGSLATKLSNMLNQRNNRVIKNWQHLAQSLGVPSDVSLSFDCDSEHSPTEDLFDHLITWNPDMTFAELKSILKSASRNDLIQILDKEGYENGWKISDNMDFVDKFKDKLDTPKRYMDWRSLASKCKISKKVFNHFGKPKLGPTKQLFLHVRISPSFEELTIKKLKEYIKEMDRYDVLKVFERHHVHDNALVKDELRQEVAIMYEVSELLDKDGPMKNWKYLAYKMGIPDHIYEGFDVSKVHNRNPTKLLLDWIFSGNPDFTLGEFIKSLRDISRNDVVVELKKGVLQGIKEQRLHTSGSTQNTDHISNEGSQGCTSNLTPDTKLSHNWDYLSEQQRFELQVTQLPELLYQKTCQILDTKEPFFRDYRMFAEALGIEKIAINSLEKKESPTHSILLKYKLNVENFLRIMKEIGREDVVVEFETWMEVPSSS